MNKSVMKCCICNNENIGEFITINNEKYHLCCINQLQEENQELNEEKQEWINLLAMFKNQQKEFIEYLENEININPYDISDYDYEDIINTILSKYKEIIGGD